jgi:hypothetical protein
VSKPILPAPQTKVAWLPSFGYGPGTPRVTLHSYSRTLETYLPGDGDAYEIMFKCSETGVERRWGTIDREEITS